MPSPSIPVAYVQLGHETDYTPGAAVVAGDVVVQGDLVGVATHDIAANVQGSVAIDGVFDFPKPISSGIFGAAGVAMWYWDNVALKATTVATNNNPIGLSVAACADADTTVRIQLRSGIPGLGFSTTFNTQSTTPAITAFATGGQAGAVLLTSMYNRIATVATQGDSVKLPVAVVGLSIEISNQGANACQVFGSGTDTINGIATATGISQSAGTIATYYCSVAGNWEVQFSVQQNSKYALLAASGAINPHVSHDYMITKAGVAVMTLAAPTAGIDDGLTVTISSDTVFAHTITCPAGVFKNGGAAVTIFTFTGTTSGGGLTLKAYNGTWKVMSSTGGAFS